MQPNCDVKRFDAKHFTQHKLCCQFSAYPACWGAPAPKPPSPNNDATVLNQFSSSFFCPPGLRAQWAILTDFLFQNLLFPTLLWTCQRRVRCVPRIACGRRTASSGRCVLQHVRQKACALEQNFALHVQLCNVQDCTSEKQLWHTSVVPSTRKRGLG